MEDIFDDLVYFLRKKNKVDVNFIFTSNFHDTLSLEEYKHCDIHLSAFYFFYNKISNGLELSWNLDKNDDIGGNMHFLKMEQFLQNWKGNLFNDKDIEQNDLIAYFHPFDLITPESQCGVMIGMDYEDNEIYFHYSTNPETFGLDIDFEGYLEMAKEAKIFLYWPKVLLDIQNKEEGVESKLFKDWMPKVFPDFDWKKFVNRYESLRLSKRKK